MTLCFVLKLCIRLFIVIIIWAIYPLLNTWALTLLWLANASVTDSRQRACPSHPKRTLFYCLHVIYYILRMHKRTHIVTLQMLICNKLCYELGQHLKFLENSDISQVGMDSKMNHWKLQIFYSQEADFLKCLCSTVFINYFFHCYNNKHRKTEMCSK